MADGDMVEGEEFRVMARQGLPAREIKRLTRLSTMQGVWSVVQILLLIGGAIGMAIVWWHPVTIFLAIIAVSGAQHALAVLSHEAGHYRLFDNRKLNDLVGVLAGMVIGVSNGCYRIVHRLHHNHLYEPNDPDLPLMAGYPRGKAYLFKRLCRDLLGLTAHKNYAYFFGAPGGSDGGDGKTRLLDDTSPRLRHAALRERWLVIVFHVAALATAFASGWGAEYLLLWVLPLVTLFQALLRLRAVMEHGAPSDTSSPVLASRTNFAPWWLGWWLFPLHVNYHIEHHLYPSIPHYRLAECHRLLTEQGALEGGQVMPIRDTLNRIFADREMPVKGV
jgi:fatty acid desaturase